VRAEVDLLNADTGLAQVAQHLLVHGNELIHVEVAKAEALLVRDDGEAKACGLQALQCFDNAGTPYDARRIVEEGNVLNERSIAIEEDGFA
jgi:hypothetical protein